MLKERALVKGLNLKSLLNTPYLNTIPRSQQPVYPKADGTVSHAKPGIHGISLDCSQGYGSSVAVTASFGNVAASRVINKTLQTLKNDAKN